METIEFVRNENVRPAWKDIAYGSSTGMVAKLFEHPFDLVKVRLQSQPIDRPMRYKGPIDCFVQTWSKEGIRGLYRARLVPWGLSMPVMGSMAETATLFTVYNQVRGLLSGMREPKEMVPSWEMAVSGAAAGSAASFVLTPVELIKCRMQVQLISAEHRAMISPTTVSPHERFRGLDGPVKLFRGQIRSSGFTGLWLGQTGTFIRECGGTMAWFLTYENVTRWFIKRMGPDADKSQLSLWKNAVGGVCAGLAYTVSLFPADCVKSSIQTRSELMGEPPKPFFRTAREIVGARGLAGLYSGCGVTCFRSSVSSAGIFVMYAALERRA